MNSVTAVCFVMIGSSLIFYSYGKRGRVQMRIAAALGGLTAFCGAFSVITFLTGSWLTLDLLLPQTLRSPSRMAVNTSILFIVIGTSSIFICSKRRFVSNTVQGLLLFSGFVSVVAFLGYLYGISSFYDLASSQLPMALNTSIAFSFISFGLLLVNTSTGFMNLLKGNTASARYARRLLPIVTILPLILGFLRILGQKAGYYNYSEGVALFVVAVIASLILIILLNTNSLRKEELKNETSKNELAKNERLLRAIIDNSPSAIYLKDTFNRFIMVNKKTEENHGIPEKDFIGKTLSYIFPDHSEDVKLFEENDRKVIESRSSKEFEEQAVLADGLHTYLSQKFALTDDNGNVYAMCGISTDITERKNATDKFIAILDSAPDAIVIVGSEGYIELVNNQTERIFGYRRDEIIGRKVETLVPDALKKVHEGHRSSFFREHSVRPMGSGLELYAKKKDGSLFPVEISLSPMKTNEGVFVSAAIRDITQRKKSEKRLKELNAELLESNNELESFSYSVSHDLRAPLRHIIGFGEKLKRVSADELSDEGNRLLDKITTSASRMGRLIDDLLMFSRVGRTGLTLAQVDMNALINDFISEQADAPGSEGVKWITGNMFPVSADPFQMKLVITNLLSNSVKYTSRSAERVIETGSYYENGENIYFVKDTGCGFDMEYSSKLFGVFQRLHADKEYEGTGIGLATVKRIISRHKGRVWAESELNKGSSFFFSIPVQQQNNEIALSPIEKI